MGRTEGFERDASPGGAGAYGFFYRLISELVSGFAEVFVPDIKESSEEGEEQGTDGDSGENGGGGGYVWLSLIDAVSQTMNHPWETTFEMTAENFLGMILYLKEKNRRQEEAIKKIKGQTTKTY